MKSNMQKLYEIILCKRVMTDLQIDYEMKEAVLTELDRQIVLLQHNLDKQKSSNWQWNINGFGYSSGRYIMSVDLELDNVKTPYVFDLSEFAKYKGELR